MVTASLKSTAKASIATAMTGHNLENPVLMGVIGAAHGIKGQCRVKSYAENPLALGDYGTLVTSDGKKLDILDKIVPLLERPTSGASHSQSAAWAARRW